MKKLLFLALVLTSTVQAQTLLTAGKMEGSIGTTASITKTYVSPSTYNYYIVGTFYDSLDVDPGPGVQMLHAIYGGEASFVTKLDYNGNFVLSLLFYPDSPSDSSVVYDVYEDYATGDIIMGGTYNGTMFLPGGAGSMGTGYQYNAFITRYSSTGAYQWIKVYNGASGNAAITSICPMGSGTLVGGYFTGTVSVNPVAGPETITSSSSEDAYIGVYGSDGSYVSTNVFPGGSGDERVKQVYFDGSNYYTAGSFSMNMNTDFSVTASDYTSAGGTDVFYCKHDGAYNLISSVQLGNTAFDNVIAANNTSLVMNYQNTLNADPNGSSGLMLTSSGGTDVAVLTFDMNTGTLQWGKSLGNSGNNTATLMGGDTYDQFYVGFSFAGSVDVDPNAAAVNVTATNNPSNSVVVELSMADGSYRAHYVTEAQYIKGFAQANYTNSNIMMAGTFNGTNVDILPMGDVYQVSHTNTNWATFFTYFKRCDTIIAQITLDHPFPCGTCNIDLSASAIGGTAPFSFNWSTDATAPAIYGECAQNFWMYAYDYHGCQSNTDYLDIPDHSTSPMSGAVSAGASSCGNNYGTASVVVTGNMGPYTLLWSNGDTTDVADSLVAGFYTVNIYDTTGCYVAEPFAVNNTDGPTVTLASANNPNCGGASSGSIDINVTGGAPPLTYLWSNGATTQDLSGVAAGTYAVIVTDAGGCQNQLCVDLTSADPITVSQLSGTNSTCYVNNGTIAVAAAGGTAPYTYQWDAAAGSQTDSNAVSLYAGAYAVTVTDALGCNVTGTFGVSDDFGPSITTWYDYPASCYYGPGYIDVSVTGSGPFIYQWNNGVTSEDNYSIMGGDYWMVATDAAGCKGFYSHTLYEFLPNPPYVCMVTVDSTGTKNVVVWDKTSAPEADHFRVYREGFCNNIDFLPIGSVSYDSLSIFQDTVVNTDTRSWRYYVTSVDACGYESDASNINKTIHLTSAMNLAGDVQLDWEAYLGHTVIRYDIYRSNAADSTHYTFLDSVPGSTLTYLDTTGLSAYAGHNIAYYVEAIPDEACYATRAFNQNASRSNHTRLAFAVQDTTGTAEILPVEDKILVYPNPAKDVVNIRVSGTDVTYQVFVMNQIGQTVNQFSLQGRTSFSTRDLHQGIYYLRLVNTQQQAKTFKLVVTR